MFTSDKGAEAPVYCNLKACGSLANRMEAIDVLTLGFSLDSLLACKARIEQSLQEPMRRLTNEHGVWLGDGLQTSCKVHRVVWLPGEPLGGDRRFEAQIFP